MISNRAQRDCQRNSGIGKQCISVFCSGISRITYPFKLNCVLFALFALFDRSTIASFEVALVNFNCQKGLKFKESLQNIGVAYSRGIWHEETLTTLEPAKNINSSMKNTQILEKNAYSLLTLRQDIKIASTLSLKTRKLKSQDTARVLSLPKWPRILLLNGSSKKLPLTL